ncbi:MAG: DNA-3-methyladenine glycosylase [Spirulinaceae cyanobacterium]
MKYSTKQAIEFLQKTDPLLEQLIAEVGEPQFSFSRADSDLLREVARAIISQQISTQAAAKIYQRFLQLYTNEGGTLTAQALLDTSQEKLRSVGISRPKIRYLYDLAQKVLAGLPTIEELEGMDDEKVVEVLTTVKGVGRWTVQMLLIFRLQRPDVLPVDDLGIRKGVQKLYALPELPERKEVERLGQKWRPYRSFAALLLWRSL